MRRCFALLVFTLFATTAQADPFQVRVMAIDSMDDFMKWIQQKPAPTGVYPRVHEVTVDKKVYLAIFVLGLDPSSHGPLDLVGEMEIVTPDGKTQALRQCCKFSVPDRTGLHMAMLSNSIAFRVDEGDPKGAYKFRATVTDGTQNVSGTEELAYGVTPKPSAAPAPAPKPAAQSKPVPAPTRKSSGSADVRDCLSKPTPGEVIKCTEGK
jgi:hypothetical protein